MRLKDYKLLFIFLITVSSFSQHKISGFVTSLSDDANIIAVEIIDTSGQTITTTSTEGYYEFDIDKTSLTLIFFKEGFDFQQRKLKNISADITLNVGMNPVVEQLSEVQVNNAKKEVFEKRSLKDVEGTEIYAGKKTEVVLVEQSMANLASNNARQLYSQVSGLNIYQNDDAGLQLNIGGRGLDPNRTANFNTRQNGYDISADVLGYPESYYSPAAEGLEEIQVVRGAASLQYGTQFGGLVNFKMKKPNPTKPFEFVTRNTVGSFGLYTNFTSVGGTSKKLSYYGFFNYKKGDGFRPNSAFDSKNAYAYVAYQFNDKTSVSAELTYLKYLAQQAGGLTDQMFNDDPTQSNRERNWFEVDWILYNFKLLHQFSDRTNFSFSFFGLDAKRNALGYRSNRVNSIDPGGERDLIKGTFKNFGFESKLLTNYDLFSRESTFLIGAKYYNSNNTSQQGPGSANSDADFDFHLDDYPNYPNQSNYTYPNLNVSVFGENIFRFSEKFSVTPGFRFEYINTQADGYYKQIVLNLAGNPISNQTFYEDFSNERSFVLLGLGSSYKANKNVEFYGNISQNYRSVTFSDISISNPAYAIDPNITDEKGFTGDFGVRGKLRKVFTYDIDAFMLSYQNRIGFVQEAFPDGSIKSLRTNVGDAVMYGLESFVDFNLNQLFIKDNNFVFNYFVNFSYTDSQYISSDIPGVEGNKVEFVPNINLKTGFKFGYKNIISSLQYTYLSQQFSDATNSVKSNLSGVIGEIPAYDVLDFSLSYSYKIFKLESGVNNILDNSYFTRRATGYPGPGIIPSPPRNYYLTLQIKI